MSVMSFGLQKLISRLLLLPMLLAGCVVPAAQEGRDLVSTDLLEGVEAMGQWPQERPETPAGVEEFAVKLLQNTLAERNDSTLVSPLSVLSALAMTANGADGDTLAQMEAALGADVDALNGFLGTYAANLPQEETCELNLANAVWFKEDPSFTVERSFLEKVAQTYDAGVYQAPFDQTTVDDINAFVAQNTKNRIQTILSELPEETVMCLVNALSFDGEWESIYDESNVHKDRIFTTQDGQERKVEMMHSAERAFLEDENATGFLKYYKGGEFAFAALLPNEGVRVEDYVAGLTGEHLADVLKNPQSIKTFAALPKFKTKFGTRLSNTLQAMGMSRAFDPLSADFTRLGRMEPEGNIWIGEVIHKTFLQVDEKGTQAGAATAVVMCGATSAIKPPEETRTVTLDRPFVYAILDTKTNLPVFLGVLMDVA